ncbi:DUF4382 domain-containing protein [Fodinibius sp.]|uniref:DUF4382 domain-containing protein n=1 Tax=Fodinibius sp. TaxID=1872440 RepID=UPI0035655CF5
MKKANFNAMLNRIIQSIFVFGAVILIAVSCKDVDFNGPQHGKAQMNVKLTDAPGDYQEVNVEVQGLRIHYTPFSDDTVNVDPDKDGKWIDLPVDPMTINLLELTNGVDTLLSSADLDPGHYQELRLILGHDNTVMVDDELHDLKVPSGQQSGYKIKFKTELEAGEELDVIIDFDASRSVHKAGRSGKYILKPVLKAFVENGEKAEAGSISGTVEPVDARPTVFAVAGSDTISSTHADTTDGGFMLRGLEEGLYDLVIEPANDQYSATTETGVSVESGSETNLDPIVLDENE